MRSSWIGAMIALMAVGCAAPEVHPTIMPTAQIPTTTQIAAVPSDTAAPTLTPTITATAPPSPTWQTCLFTAGSEGAVVYALPLPTYATPPAPLGEMAAGQSAPVAYRGAGFGDEWWLGVAWDGGVGYVRVEESDLTGDDCPTLFDLDTYAGTGPTVESPDQIDYRIHMDGAVGTIWVFTQTLPSDEGDFSHMIQITAELQSGSVRWLDYEIDCVGEDAARVQWGWWSGTTAAMGCDGHIRETLNISTKHYIEVSLPPDSAPMTYTLTITLSQYSP